MEWMIYTIIGVLVGIFALIGMLLAATSTREREDRLNEWIKEGAKPKPYYRKAEETMVTDDGIVDGISG